MIDQAKAAAVVKMIGKLLRKHPLIAAELALTGVVRGVAVGMGETRDRLFAGHDADRRGVASAENTEPAAEG